jgi:hypothetical protein
MYFREHGMPHFHAAYAGETVVIAIQTGHVIAGTLQRASATTSPRSVSSLRANPRHRILAIMCDVTGRV